MVMDCRDTPNRIAWPPLIYGAAILLALGLERICPLGQGWMAAHRPVLVVVGLAAMAVGAGLDSAAMLTMRRHRANILPHRPATTLLTTGPFAWSRNPIYLGNTVMLAGAGVAFANAWLLGAALAAAAAVSGLAIRREERHLEARFGASWLAYRARTPRWLGIPARLQ